ncbi:helix-turn-helix domain-containing protein [Streptosporangium sp. NBC_01755]|uniref:helix-turn-helix domain-containing protein n=1 Tax=unclassified Streptosporangium TaxID=2632669 RepID=UPI002DDC729F|nr:MULTISPECIES: helix-turn-helix domain-containing protein [unclassified Streptosporangium]WSA25623.1 helix-turn-helix domain-containing protein [Streptosporangium sp. NBC_01810]WSD02989.1 helix-turn-helix domain-containing protein [Streptosporangium sp. NBC_01755]
MSTEYQRALGRRIAQERKRRGLSQPELARLVDRSVAWISQVERGVRKVDRMSVLEKVAEALDIPLSELAAEAPVVAASAEEIPGTAGLRLVLSGAHSLRAMLHSAPVLATSEIKPQVDRAWALTHESRYVELADLLRGLVPALETAARSAPEERRAELFELLAVTYQACSAALAKLGEPEAAWIAADRAIVAAERAGNPLMMAAGAFRLGFVFLGARHFDQVEETARTAAEALWFLVDEGNPEAMSLWGGLTLQRAVASSRLNEADAAYQHLARAREVARQLEEGRNDYNTEFGPANVALHEVAVAVELGDAGHALRVGTAVDTSTLSNERCARLQVDLARAHAQRRQIDQAVSALLAAEAITPEQIQNHRTTHQLVSDLLAMQDPPSPELRGLADRVGA